MRLLKIILENRNINSLISSLEEYLTYIIRLDMYNKDKSKYIRTLQDTYKIIKKYKEDKSISFEEYGFLSVALNNLNTINIPFNSRLNTDQKNSMDFYSSKIKAKINKIKFNIN